MTDLTERDDREFVTGTSPVTMSLTSVPVFGQDVYSVKSGEAMQTSTLKKSNMSSNLRLPLKAKEHHRRRYVVLVVGIITEIPGIWDFFTYLFDAEWMARVPMTSFKYMWVYLAYFVIMVVRPRGLFGWKQ